jgi:hypothetical protein
MPFLQAPSSKQNLYHKKKNPILNEKKTVKPPPKGTTSPRTIGYILTFDCC